MDRDPFDDVVLAEQGLSNPETKVDKVVLVKKVHAYNSLIGLIFI